MIGLRYIMFITDTQLKEIANNLNVTPQLIAAWSKGTRNISREHSKILSEYFNLDEKYFSKELTLEDKVNIELKLANKTYLEDDIKDLSKVANDITSMRKKYKELLEKYIKLNNEHERLKEVMNSIADNIKQTIN